MPRSELKLRQRVYDRFPNTLLAKALETLELSDVHLTPEGTDGGVSAWSVWIHAPGKSTPPVLLEMVESGVIEILESSIKDGTLRLTVVPIRELPIEKDEIDSLDTTKGSATPVIE